MFAKDMHDAVTVALSYAAPGDAILLSQHVQVLTCTRIIESVARASFSRWGITVKMASVSHRIRHRNKHYPE